MRSFNNLEKISYDRSPLEVCSITTGISGICSYYSTYIDYVNQKQLFTGVLPLNTFAMITNLELVWADHYTATIELEDNPVSQYMLRCVKHLQHLPLTFNCRDNPLVAKDLDSIHSTILSSARQLGVHISVDRLDDQDYINELHDVYMLSYSQTKDTQWMPFHDALHSIEDARHRDRKSIWVDYKDRAGPLIQPFDRSLLRYGSSTVGVGDCRVGLHELGKSFWAYHQSGEPNDIDRICAVVTPWQFLKPVLSIFYQPCDEQTDPYHSNREFRDWVDEVSTAWAKHWGIQGWSPGEISPRLRVGHLPDMAEVEKRFSVGDTPIQLRPQI